MLRAMTIAAVLLVTPASAGEIDSWLASNKPMDAEMRDAFDKAAKKWLYREGCRCLVYLDDDRVWHKAPWPITRDADRKRILEVFANGPWVPNIPNY
jgi:hypothetical protein